MHNALPYVLFFGSGAALTIIFIAGYFRNKTKDIFNR